MIKRLHLENFTAFDELTMDFSPGINLIIGVNGTGKTHILKVLYAMLTAPEEELYISGKIIKTFLPDERDLGRLIKRMKYISKIEVATDDGTFDFGFDDNTTMGGGLGQVDELASTVYIPVKEMLANAPGFRSLYNLREIHFEAVYVDIIDKALLPPLKNSLSEAQQNLLMSLQEVMEGEVTIKGERFYLSDKQGELEFTLLAEGIRKFALLWLLIRNGSLQSGSTLFWDEPEANLNPALMKTLVKVLIELQRQGVQIFIATHNYVLLKEFELQTEPQDSIRFFSLARDKATKDISCRAGDDYLSIVPNKISEAHIEIYDKEMRRSLGGVL